ncbi:MAG: translation initiation factor [Deltaproteobacteria bacterium]|nr:translation initiation factor [Deltaproteobacteria bacterium]
MKNKKSQSKGNDAEEYRLVYSSDPQPKAVAAVETSYSGPITPAIRMERSGRSGKTVTVLAKLPAHETLLKDLCAFLKRSLGSGGSFAVVEGQGVIEIQGDRREQVPALIEQYRNKK